MKTWKRLLPLVALLLPTVAPALDLPRIVSGEWLEKNGSDPQLRIVDIRKPEDYKAGHVPNSVNVFYGSWAVKGDGLDNQQPEAEDLADLIRDAGIDGATPVVVVGSVETTTDQVNNTRVAWTLRGAGVAQVGVLDGGFTKWSADKKPTVTEATKPEPAKAAPAPGKSLAATKAEVAEQLGKATILDTRLPDAFFGVSKLPLVQRAGHLPNAVNLPSAWVFTKEGAFKPADDLAAMAEGVVGTDKAREIITYCDTGRLASGWWFVLSEVLGYQNVKLYDGSTQEWSADAEKPMVKYSWK